MTDATGRFWYWVWVFKRSPIEPHGFLEGEVVLDWLYGKACPTCQSGGHSPGDTNHVAPTPGLVERVRVVPESIESDAPGFMHGVRAANHEWVKALRAELGMEEP